MAKFVAASEALRHLRIPSSHIRCTGVELGNGSYGKVFEVDYSGKLCAAKEVQSCPVLPRNFRCYFRMS